jgi:cytochrome oxidase Cu insertion factor (SCO1/SenC/PrrC family)
LTKSKLELDVIVVIQAIGNAPQKLSAYLRTYTGNVHYQVVSVDEDDETADALRAIKDKIDVKQLFVTFKQESRAKNLLFFFFFFDRETLSLFLATLLQN